MQYDENQGGNKPDEHDAYGQYEPAVGYPAPQAAYPAVGFGEEAFMLFREKIIYGNAENIGDLFYNNAVRDRLSPFPLRDRFIGIIDFFGQFRLRHAFGTP